MGTSHIIAFDANEEVAEAIAAFIKLLLQPMQDGAKKLGAGEKVHWTIDQTHEPALFSHLNKWKHRELRDKDSGAHPLVHLACRALMIAWQETHQQSQDDDHWCPQCEINPEPIGNAVDRSGLK